MYLISNGWISVSPEHVKKATDALNKVLEKTVVDEYVRHNDSVVFYIEDEPGDLEERLNNAVSELANENVFLNGRVYYSGDYAGCYVIEDGIVRSESYDIISDISDEDLLAEIKRRMQKKKDTWRLTDSDRLQELMNGMINYMTDGEDPQSVIKFLIHRGFTDAELVKFCFEKDAIAQAHDSDDGNGPEMVFC